MEALYGYMSESELENSIMEKEFDIEMGRLFLESEYITEAGNTSKKQNVFQKMITTIKEFIQKILDSMSDFMDKMKEKKIESKLKDAPPVKMDYDPRKRFNEIEKNVKSTLNKLKHPGLIKKDESGTHLTDRGKKVVAGAGITFGAITLYDVYRRINRMMKELNNHSIAINSHQTEIKHMRDDMKVDDLVNNSEFEIVNKRISNLQENINKRDESINKEITNLQNNIKEANELRQDLENSMKESIKGLKNDKIEIRRSIGYNSIINIVGKLKNKYNLTDDEARELKHHLQKFNDVGVTSEDMLIVYAKDYMRNDMERFDKYKFPTSNFI